MYIHSECKDVQELVGKAYILSEKDYNIHTLSSYTPGNC